ncbi:endoplasmic reticulum vesicle transporter protein [Striga asiatica]|uniref:Endoplasmic reticulum vesicle transporter protein n=1 Tax=Striga asiatica TaxID=4170 RepID=A0A5A7PBV6_STRAF|nr:endoplasmic reticulum vesicle transporter protein [Striga asiatica]
MSTTVWLDRNSKTPSLATTKNGCSGARLTVDTSGSETTPIFSAILSPTLLVKAVPGVFNPLHLVNAQNPCPTQLHPLTLILPKRGLIIRQVLGKNSVPIPDPKHGPRISHIGHVQFVPNHEGCNCGRPTHGVINFNSVELVVGRQEG